MERDFHVCFVLDCCVNISWWSSLEKTNWLHHISLLLKATNIVVNAIHKERRPVVVHCSDGWDRTTQIVALAELMLDPYYRTIEVHCTCTKETNDIYVNGHINSETYTTVNTRNIFGISAVLGKKTIQMQDEK